MKYTDNLNLSLYESTDSMNITGSNNSLNHNMGIIDEAINNTQKELTTQSGRIDNLILNSGDSSTEVIDARVGADGNTYSTLKERLDTENSKIKSECNTYSTKTEVSVVEGKADDALAAANANSENLTNFINTTTNNLEDLQGQLDGSIMTHFYEYEPTNTNIPASEWTTTELKNNHLGDLFYDTITGYCYRWQVSNNTYSWNRITDVDVTKALADAAKAQDTADNKRRVFVSTPTPPYDVGDLWTQGSDGDIMRCKIAKTSSQSYAAADWEKASKYTDDTKADAVADNLANTNTNLSTVTTNLSKAQQDILTNAGLINSQGDLIAGNTAEIKSQAETISNHESRISRTETDISLKVSSSDFESYKTTVTGTIDTAKSEAINAASADAISKADQALTNAKNYTSAEIETVNESISKANTEITAMKGQIALKVEQSDIDNVETTVKTYVDDEVADTLKEAKTYTDEREAAINVTLNGISSKVSSVESSQTTINGNVSDLQTRMSSAEEKITPTAIINTVSSTYATKTENQAALDAAKVAQEDINNLEIGGRNLVTNSVNLSDFAIESSNCTTRTIADDYCIVNRLVTPNSNGRYGIYKDIPVTAGEEYTVSLTVKEVTGTMNFSFGSDAATWGSLGSSELSVGRFIKTITAPSNATFLRLYINGNDGVNGGSVTVSNIKFEKGNKATDWTPAPEDVDAGISNAQTAADNAQDEVNEISDKTRSGLIETLSGSGFVQSTKTEDGGMAEVVVYGKSVQDGTPTPDAPVEIQSVENAKVKSCGKNLVDIKEALDYWGCTYTEENGIYTITYSGNAYAKPFIFTNTASIYTLSAIQTSVNVVNEKISFAYVDKTGNIIRNSELYANGASITSRSNVNAIYLDYHSTSSGWSRTIENLQVELGNTATNYEPYQAKTTTLSDIVLRSTPDGTKDRLFKDSDWLWKVERNCAYISSYNGESIATSYYSNTGELSTGASVVYALEVPTYETLSDSIQSELRALTTYNPVTNVIASDGVTPDIDVSFWTRDYRTKNTAEVAKTTAEQTADKFTWIVESGTSSSNFTLTDRVASLLSSEFQIDALTTFKNSATDGTSTVIDGGAIKANTISADKINVPDLSALRATIGGFTIGNSALHNGTTSLAGADNSVYLGLDGISCGTKFKVDKKGVLSTADIKMEKTKTENDITSTFGLYISSPDSWTGSGLAVPGIRTRTDTVVDGVTFSNELQMYPFKISLVKHVSNADDAWLRLEPTKMSMFSYINNDGFTCPELFIQPGGANSVSSVTMGKETHQIYSVEWTDDPYDYDDPLASCPHNMYPVTFNASAVTFNSAVDVNGTLQVQGTAVSLNGHKHSRLCNTADSSYEAQVALVLDGDYYYFRGSEASKYVCGSEVRPWYKTFTERLEVTKGKPVFTYVGSDGGGSAVSYATNMYVGSTGTVSRTTNTSSRTIKHDITELQDEQIKAENLYNVNVYQAKYNEDILSSNDPRYLKDLPMFIIEDLDEKYPIVIDKPSENVKEWSWNAQYIIPPMLKLIQNQHQTDINLENKIKDLESKLDKALEIIDNLTNN